MAALTTMAIVGAAALSQGYSAIQQRKGAKAQEKAIRDQERKLRIQAENQQLVQGTNAEVAEVELGRQDDTATKTPAVREGTAVAAAVGGLRKRNSVGLGL